MSFSGRHHIPFPKTWLTVNTPLKQSKPITVAPPPAAEPIFSAHGFLSNLTSRPATVPRHSSISSVSSIDSAATAASTTSAPPTHEPAAAPFAKQTGPAFLSLNAKYAAPATAAQAMKEVETHGFLSNRL